MLRRPSKLWKSRETEDLDDNIPTEIMELLESCMTSRAPAINNKEARLICNLFPGMVKDDNQPFPQNIPTTAEQQDSDPTEFFRGWEHSGSCYQCLNGGRKNNSCLNFNHENNYLRHFFKEFIIRMVVPATC